MPERFPPPWSVGDNGSAWYVADANGFKVGWFYYRRDFVADTAIEHMTREQAYAMAVNFARVPVWLGRQKG